MWRNRWNSWAFPFWEGEGGSGGNGGNPPPAGGNPLPSGGDNPPPSFPTLKPGEYGNNPPPGGDNPPPGGNPPPPGGDNPPPNPAAEFHGAPDKGQYADFTVPEGFTIDQGLVTKFAPIAAELGLSQKGAQRLADFYAKEVVGPQSAAFVDQISNWFGETEKDPEIGGDKFEASTKAAGRALDVFGTKGLRGLLVEYGLGNHPEVVRFFTRVGNAIGEDSAAGGKGGNGQQPKDFLTLMYGPPKTQ